MKRNFLPVVLPAAFTFFTACNSGDKKEQLPLTDSLIGKDSLVSMVSKDSLTEENLDYTKRRISIPPSEWPELELRMHHGKAYPSAVSGSIKGDFNGDGTPETIYMVAPVTDSTAEANQDCYGSCYSYVTGSGNILIVHDNLGGEIKNIGDMDGDGADDLLVYPSWWQSNWNPYRLYSVKKSTGEWRYLTEPVSIFTPDLYANSKRVLVKRSAKPGFLTVYSSDTNEDGDVKTGYRDVVMIK